MTTAGRRSVAGMADMLTIDQAAERAGVSAKTIRRNVTAGRYAGSVRGEGGAGRWLIPADVLDAEHGVTVVTIEPEYADAPAANGAHSGTHLATLPADPTVAGPILLSVQAVAGVLGITEYAVRQAIKRDQLLGYPWGPGGALLVPVAELRRLAGA